MVSRKIFLFAALLLSGCQSEKNTRTAIDFGNDPVAQSILSIVQKEYVEDPNLEKMREGALSGMLMALDGHSLYMNEENFKAFTQSTNGQFGGVGLEVVYGDGGLRVLSPIDDTPAAKAGLQPGDIISHVDGEIVSSTSYANVLKKIHGTPGTTVELTIQRGEQEPFKVKILREIVNINPVKFVRQENIGYIRISYFNDKTDKSLKQAITSLKNHSTPLTGIVLDLRNNPGGILEQAVAVASQFLGEKDIVRVKNRDAGKDRTLKGSGEDLLKGIPMMVLINAWSASASEIVAAALHDYKRAILIGKRTFGKGSVQSLFPLEGQGGIKITTARFYSPNDQPIQDTGVSPDINVETQPLPHPLTILKDKSLMSEDDAQLRRAVDILRGVELLQEK